MNALCTAPSRPVRNPTTRGETCRCVDESFAPTRALRAVWTNPWTTRMRCPPPCPHSRASRPQAPQDQPPVILTGQHRTSLRRGCLHRPFKTTSASHSNRSQHRPRAGSPPTLQAHFRMGLDSLSLRLSLRNILLSRRRLRDEEERVHRSALAHPRAWLDSVQGGRSNPPKGAFALGGHRCGAARRGPARFPGDARRINQAVGVFRIVSRASCARAA